MSTATSTTLAPAQFPLKNSHPLYTVQTDRNAHSIIIGPWTIVATKKPILNGKEIEGAEKLLSLPLPEMTFGNNSLSLTYNPSAPLTTTSSIEIRFQAKDALAGVATGEGWEERVGGGVLVSMAERWSKNKSWTHGGAPSPTSSAFDVPMPSKPVKPHDWTYSTCYAGTVAGPSKFEPSSSHTLPLDLLARQDPILDQILYYEDVSLYDDELHDNGESILNVRIRVMPHSFFILARLFVRVDNVLFRIHDTRIYHSFDSDEVIREASGMEAEYDQVRQFLETPTDLSPLTESSWVYKVMTSLSGQSSRRSSRTGKPWPGLGKTIDVLKLPNEDMGKIEHSLQNIQI
nr:hypothetical protein L204_00814 [Cryptococcus depauperatus CBS 7855]